MGVSHHVGGCGKAGASPWTSARPLGFILLYQSLKALHLFAVRPHPTHRPLFAIGFTLSQFSLLPYRPHPLHRPHLSTGPAPYPGRPFPRVSVLIAQWCPTLHNPMDCSQRGSSVQGILQATVLEWVAISFSRGSS